MASMDIDQKMSLPLDDLVRQSRTQRRARKGFVSGGAGASATDGDGDAMMGGTAAPRRQKARKRVGSAPVVRSAGVSTGRLPNRRSNNRRGGAEAMDIDGGDIEGRWSHDKFAGGAGNARGRGIIARLGGPGEEKAVRGFAVQVRNLFPKVTHADVLALFQQFCTVKSVRMNKDENGLFLGSADVTLASMEDVEQAMRLNNRLFDGQPLVVTRVEKAVQRSPRANKPQGGIAGRLFSTSVAAATQGGDLRLRLGGRKNGGGLSTNALRSQRKQGGDVKFTVRLK